MADHLDCRHVTFLVECLSKVAYGWREIGTALEFQSRDLRNIEASPSLIATAPRSFMQRLVEEWLEGKYPHTAPPTLANLLKALNSCTVGLGTLATQIKNSLPQHGQSVDAKLFVIASVSDQGDITFNRSEDIKVGENSHVHLKAELNSRSNMRHSSVRHGLCSSLCLPKVDLDMDGYQYSCIMKQEVQYSWNLINLRVERYRYSRFREDFYSNDYEAILSTSPVTLRVSCPHLDQFRESIASIYLAQPEVPQDSWPPVSSRAYINLAIVKQQQAIDYSGKYARLTIRGDIDDILCHKERIEYTNIFDGLRSGSLLFIEGRPGSGKTTFVHKITKDWAASEVQGPRRLLLLVSLRVLNSWEKPVTFEDILQLFNIQVSSTVLQERSGKGICFIFDGLDEFSPLEAENSIIYKIINKTYLPQSIVIVASRPAALVKLRQRADKVIEVIGFPKDQIFEYIRNYPFSNTLKVDQLKKYLLSHPNVLHMCYLPIHAAMVAFLFEVMGKVPRTETEIYTHFTRLTIMRSLSKHKEHDEIEDMDIGKLSGEKRELFDTICKFALEKTILKKQVVDEDEIKLRLQGKGCKDISLGLVTVDRTAGLYGFKNIYTFLHLTYQEYLAAHHISTLSDEDQLKLIKEYGDTDHMQVVWKFYCGLVNFEEHEHNIKALVSGKKKIFLSDIQCAYESQQKIVCKCFMKEMDAQIILEDKYLTTSDFTALGYLLANSPIPVSLSLSKCNMNTEAVSALLKETEEKLLCLRALSYESDCIDLESLLRLLSKQHSLECLKISSRTTLRDSGFSDIINTSLINLKEISLINIQIEPTTLTGVLQFCKELSFLTCTIGDNQQDQFNRRYLRQYSNEESLIESLLSGVSNCKKLERVFFSAPIMHHSVLCAIILTRSSAHYYTPAADLHEGRTVVYVQGKRDNFFQTLILKSERTNILEYNLESTSKYWPPRPKLLSILAGFYCDNNINLTSDFSGLEKLYLKNVYVNTKLLAYECENCGVYHEEDRPKKLPERVTTILAGLRSSSNLQKLFLNNMYFKLDDSCILAFCLQHWPKLQELHLRGCGIKEEGAKAIADNIKYCLELTEVDLREIENDTNSIAEGIATIIEGLKNCPNLQKLVLIYKYIKTDDARVLASCLQHWPKLQELHLRGCGVGEGAKAIADNIKYCPELTVLELSENEINHKSSIVEGITIILTSLNNCSNLQKLIFNNICIKTDGAYVLASCLQHWPKLQELHLRGCGIEEEGAKAIADSIKYCPELAEVCLSENENDMSSIAEGIATFLTSLKNCSTLQKLVLNNVNIKTDGVCVLASCLQHWPKLQELHLRGCGVGEGAKAIADNIKRCPELTKVDLSENNSHKSSIIAEGITTFLTSLKNCSNLLKLILNNLNIQTDGACVLASCLQHWPKLQELHLRGCGVGKEGAKAISDNIKYCPELTVLDLITDSRHMNNAIKSTLQSHRDMKRLHHQMSKCQKPHEVTDQLHHQMPESQQLHNNMTDQSYHQAPEFQQSQEKCSKISESQQPHDRVTDQSCHQMSESQQPQDKAISENVSSVGKKGGRGVRRKKWRKTATRSSGTLPVCETELDPKKVTKSQAEITSQDAGLLKMTQSLHADSHNKPDTNIAEPIKSHQNDHVAMIEFDSMLVGSEPPQSKKRKYDD